MIHQTVPSDSLFQIYADNHASLRATCSVLCVNSDSNGVIHNAILLTQIWHCLMEDLQSWRWSTQTHFSIFILFGWCVQYISISYKCFKFWDFWFILGKKKKEMYSSTFLSPDTKTLWCQHIKYVAKNQYSTLLHHPWGDSVSNYCICCSIWSDKEALWSLTADRSLLRLNKQSSLYTEFSHVITFTDVFYG